MDTGSDSSCGKKRFFARLRMTILPHKKLGNRFYYHVPDKFYKNNPAS
jgi:hypothetical protein